jgi:hypothetical protein
MIRRKSLTLIMGIGAEMKYAGRACEPCAMRESCRYQDHFLPPASLPHFHPTKNVGQAGGKWGRSNKENKAGDLFLRNKGGTNEGMHVESSR